MKEKTHPDYHEITVIMTDGTEFVTRSTYGQKGARLLLDIDSKTHPAWTGMHRAVNRGGQLEKFNKRFAGLSAKKDEAGDVPASPVPAAEKIKLTTSAPSKKKKA